MKVATIIFALLTLSFSVLGYVKAPRLEKQTDTYLVVTNSMLHIRILGQSISMEVYRICYLVAAFFSVICAICCIATVGSLRSVN